jgi:hypothetical protein
LTQNAFIRDRKLRSMELLPAITAAPSSMRPIEMQNHHTG